jgi:hypothetical protein
MSTGLPVFPFSFEAICVRATTLASGNMAETECRLHILPTVKRDCEAVPIRPVATERRADFQAFRAYWSPKAMTMQPGTNRLNARGQGSVTLMFANSLENAVAACMQ